MPKASVHEDHSPAPWEHKVWSPWKSAATEPVAKASAVQLLADKDLESRVFLPYAAHPFGALLSG